jgi:hypothetical protein
MLKRALIRDGKATPQRCGRPCATYTGSFSFAVAACLRRARVLRP